MSRRGAALAIALCLGTTMLVVEAPTVPATHDTEDWKDRLGLKTQNLTDWVVSHRPALQRAFWDRAHAFEDVNLTNAEALEENATTFQQWVRGQVAQLEAWFNPANGSRLHLINLWDLKDSTASSAACSGSPQTANHLLLATALLEFYQALELTELAPLNANHTDLPAQVRQGLTFLLGCLADALDLRQDALASITKTEFDWLVEQNANLSLISPLDNATIEQEETLYKALVILDKINITQYSRGASLVVDAVELTGAFLDGCTYGAGQPDVQNILDKLSLIRIGGNGTNNYTTDHAIHIDCGGDDTYNNNPAGASTPDVATCKSEQNTRFCPLAIAVDVAGNDSYEVARAESPHLGGSNTVSFAVFLDRKGDDAYTFGRGLARANTGSVGVFHDSQGDDTYNGTLPMPSTAIPGTKKGSIGAAQTASLSLFIDDEGDDTYVAEGADAFGQGLLGGATLFLEAEGNDSFEFRPYNIGNFSGGQAQNPYRNVTGPGFGLGEVAGLAIHYDRSGNDTRTCLKPVNYGCMGGGASAGIGFLIENGTEPWTHDTYNSEAIHNHTLRTGWPTSAGIGITSGVGILADLHGNDIYEAEHNAQGFGGCTGVGILLDEEGTDTYTAHNGSAQGWGVQAGCLELITGNPILGGFGFLFDGGAEDVFENPEDPALCRYVPPEGTDVLLWVHNTTALPPGLGFGYDDEGGENDRCGGG